MIRKDFISLLFSANLLASTSDETWLPKQASPGFTPICHKANTKALKHLQLHHLLHTVYDEAINFMINRSNQPNILFYSTQVVYRTLFCLKITFGE